MGQSCKFCQHQDRAVLEERLASNTLSQHACAEIIGCDRASVSRHMVNHAAAKVAQIKGDIAQIEGTNVINALTNSHQRTLDIIEDSLLDHDRRTALLAIQAETRQLELMAKLTGVIGTAPQFNFLLDARYMKVKNVMMKVLDPYPDLKEQMADALLDVDTDGESDAQY